MTNNNQQNNNNTQQTKYTNVKVASFYSDDSALTLGYSSDGFSKSFATISLAPRFEETKGREPKRGEKIYDYDNTIFVSLDATNLVRLNDRLSHFMDPGSNLGEIEVRTGSDVNGASIRIIRESSIEDYKGTEISPDVVLYIEKVTGDSTVACTYPFKAEEITALFDIVAKPSNATSDEVSLGVSNPEFEVFAKWVSISLGAILAPIDYIPLKTKLNGGNSAARQPAQSTGRFISRRSTNGNSNASQNAAQAANAEADWATNDEDGDLPF